ncbi:MAG: hypothetical protein LBG61_05225 [Burkholderiales bacterium]|jgi:dihydroorotate dehydrogenase|nr:hypothetical protein [Burkholderiales bacterium]
MSVQPFYNPAKTYDDNYREGPFGLFAEDRVLPQPTEKPLKRLLGLPVFEPFGIPAGPLLNARFCEAAFRFGFDLAVYKTVRSAKRECLPFPNIIEVKVKGQLVSGQTVEALSIPEHHRPNAITNSFGVPSQSPEIWQPDMKNAVHAARAGQILIGSFQGSGEGEAQVKDYIKTAQMVVETGAPVLEANLSCPNEGKKGLLCFDVDKVSAIVSGIKKAVNDRPLLLKLAYFEDEALLASLVRAVGDRVEGFCAINTLQAYVVDSHGKSPLPGRDFAGICGADIRWAGLIMTQRLAAWRDQLKLNYTIVGGGGVMAKEDYHAYINHGADAVMSATGAMWNPLLAQEIKSH